MTLRQMPEARHILSYAQTLAGGGVERALLRLARGWIAAGRRVTLVLGTAEGPLAAELPAGVEVVRLGSDRYRAMLALPRIVEARRPDILFCPGNHYSSVALWTRLRLARRCPPIVAKMSNAATRGDHGALADAAHRAWLSLHRRFVDHLVAMTPATAQGAAQAMRMSADRVSVIPNPPAAPIAGAASVPLPPGRYILGVGRLAPQKRWDRLIAALPALADPDLSLVIMGEGAERAALFRQAEACGVAHRLHLPGHTIDPFPAMAGAVLLALTSDFEGVPGVLREALSVGTPVVSTDSSAAVAEIVDDPVLGSIVARGDHPALVAALDRWAAPRAIRPRAVPQPGEDAAMRYLALFDRLLSA